MHDLRRIAFHDDPLQRVRLATAAMAACQESIVELGRIRREAIDLLRSQGITVTEIAQQSGISRARLSQVSTPRKVG